MAILTFEVKGQTLTVKSSIGRIVEKSIEYLDFEILTSKDWVCNSNDEKTTKALSKKLMITTKEGTFEFFPGSYITKNVIIAPGFEASVIGYEAEPGLAPRQITTNSVFVSVCPSGRTEKTGDPPNTRPNISNIDAIAGQVTELREELYGKEADGSIKEKTLEGSIEDEIKQNKNDIQTLQESLDTHINNIVEDFEGNTDNNDKYPSVKAVYDFVNQSEHITKITEMNTYIWDLPSGIYTFAAIDKVQKIYFTAGVNQSCGEGAFLIVGGENYSGDLPSATTFKKSVIFLRNVKAAMAQIIAGISTVTYTIDEDGKVTYTAEWDGGIIESQDNKTNVIDESVTNNQYPSAKAVYSYGASIVEDFNSTIIEKTDEIKTEITDRSPALKNKKEDYKKLVISDVSNIEHNLSVLLHDGQGALLANALLYCKGKNLFGLDDREVCETSFHDKTNPPEGRDIFNGNRIFTGYACSNYYSPGRVEYNYTQETITLKSTHSSYGLAIDIEVTPKTSYCVSMKEKIEGFGFNVGFYDHNGKYLGYASSLDKKLVFTTPENAKWALVNIFPTEGYQDKSATFFEVQLEEGQDSTFFEKPYPTQLTMSDTNGKILSFKSNYPTTILESNNPQTKITCEYNQDINKAYEKLKTAIEKLGGTIE